MNRGILNFIFVGDRVQNWVVGFMVAFTVMAQVLLYFAFRNAAEQRAQTQNRTLQNPRTVQMGFAEQVNPK